MNSLFENDSLDYILLSEDKISCLNYFGYRLSATKTTFINSDKIPSRIIYIKKINEISLIDLFNVLSEVKK